MLKDKENVPVNQPTWSGFVCPANQHPKSTIKKKSPHTFAHLVNLSQIVSFMLDNHKILLFWLWNKQTFRMFSLRALFTWSRRTMSAKDRGLFYLNYPEINKVGKSVVNPNVVLLNVELLLEYISKASFYKVHSQSCAVANSEIFCSIGQSAVVWVRKPNFGSFCCDQPFVCQLSSGPPGFFTFSYCAWLWNWLII